VIYATGPETSEIYDVGCPFLDKASWVDLSSDIKKASDPDLIERLNQNLEVNKRARVVVVGEFDGPKQVAVPPNTPASVAALMRAVNSRYGHQNMYNFRFLILKVEKVESVDKTEIWPRWAAKGKR
jgi:hypothetical protein